MMRTTVTLSLLVALGALPACGGANPSDAANRKVELQSPPEARPLVTPPVTPTPRIEIEAADRSGMPEMPDEPEMPEGMDELDEAMPEERAPAPVDDRDEPDEEMVDDDEALPDDPEG